MMVVGPKFIEPDGPWQVNVNGTARHFATREEADAWVAVCREAGRAVEGYGTHITKRP